MTTHPYLSEFAGNYYLSGADEGEARGKILAKQDDVLEFLDARGLEVSDLLRSQVRDMTDRDELGRWVRRAASVKRAEDLLLEPSERPASRFRRLWRRIRRSS